MARHVQQPSQATNRAATLAHTAALARRQLLLQRRHQEAVATAGAVCHRAHLQLARQRVRRQRGQGQVVGRWPGEVVADIPASGVWLGGRCWALGRLGLGPGRSGPPAGQGQAGGDLAGHR